MNQMIFWEEAPHILDYEIEKMANQYPDFTLEEYLDGRKYWKGEVKLQNSWHLRVEYDMYYPNWWLKQDLIRVYCDDPNLEQNILNIDDVPRILMDAEGKPYISTYLELVKNKRYIFSAPDHLEFAINWILAYENWKQAIELSQVGNPYIDYFYRGKRLQKKKLKGGVAMPQKEEG